MDYREGFGDCERGKLDDHRFRLRRAFLASIILGAAVILISGPLAILRPTSPEYLLHLCAI